MGSGLSSGLGSGSTRARDYSDLFYHRRVSQGICSMLAKLGARLETQLVRWVSAQLCLGSFRLVSDQFWPRFGWFRFGSLGMARLVSKLSSSWLEAWFGEARGLVRLNSGIRPGRTRFEARYFGSALFEARIGISARGSVWCLTARLNSKALLGTRSLAGG